MDDLLDLHTFNVMDIGDHNIFFISYKASKK